MIDILAIAVGQRADELSKGAKPLLELNTQKWNILILLLMKLQQGLLKIEGFVDKK